MTTPMSHSDKKLTYQQSVFNRLKSLSVNEEIKFDKSKGSVADWNKFLESVRLFYSADFWFEVSHNSVKKVAKETKEGAQKVAENWDDEIKMLENYFSSVVLPQKQVALNQYTTIMDVKEFIEGHLQFIHNNNGKRIFRSYVTRLQELKIILESKKE